MQFAFVESLALPGIPFVWVYAKRPDSFIERACACKEIYPVVLEMLPEVLRRFAAEEMAKNGTQYVGLCECGGRIIE